MKAAESFVSYFESSYTVGKDLTIVSNLSDEFFCDFIRLTPLSMDKLQDYLGSSQWGKFHLKLNDLKYLCEYSDNLSRYWYILRGYSSALEKISDKPTVKNTKQVYVYYYNRYGDRRILKDEHWFEKLRWEFLDEIPKIYLEAELNNFIVKYHQAVQILLNEYRKDLENFIREVQFLVKKKNF